MTQPACITGMHRSGTSMVARAAQALGVWLGDPDELVPAAADNPDGFFEHERLVAASDVLFERLGGGWDCPPALPAGWRDDPRVAAARDLAAPTLAALAAHGAWGWKDPRAAAVLPFWLDLVPTARVVLCVRNPLEVAASLRARNGVSLALGLQLWMRYTDAALASVPETGRLVTHYAAWFEQPDAEVARLAEFLELAAEPAQTALAAAVLARHARHSRFDGRALRRAGVDPAVLDLYTRLCAEAAWADGAAVVEGASSADALPASNGSTAPAAEPSVAMGRVDRSVVDVGLAQYQVHKRNGRVAQLEKRVEQLEGELAARQATPAGPSLEELQAGMYDLQLTVGELAARMTNGADAETTDRDVAYLRMIRAVRSAVREHVPSDADVLVISEREPALVDLHGRTARHFPVGPTPDTPGPNPADGAAAAAHLVARQALGATHIVVPPTATWRLATYPALADRLARAARAVVRLPEGASIHQLGSPREPDRWETAAAAVAAAARRTLSEPSVLDWTTAGLDGVAAFRPPDKSPTLPYLDASIDVVAIDAAASPVQRGEAERVASAGVLTAGLDGWARAWTGAPRPVVADVVVVAARLDRPAAYLDTLLGTLPAGHRGRLTVIAPPEQRTRWEAAVGERGTVVPADGTAIPRGAASGLHDDGCDFVVVIDGTSVPLEGWLPALLAPFERGERVGLVSARRRAHQGAPITASQTMTDRGLTPDVGVVDATLTESIDCAIPGAVAIRRGLLTVESGLEAQYRTLSYSLAAFCRTLSRSGHDVLVQPEAEVVELGLGGPTAADLAADHVLTTESVGAVTA